MPPPKKRKPGKKFRTNAPLSGLKRARQLLEQALTKQDPDEIAALARQAVEIFPDFMEAHLVLAGAKRLPRKLPEYVTSGEDSEAVFFISEFLTCWRSTPGAIP